MKKKNSIFCGLIILENLFSKTWPPLGVKIALSALNNLISIFGKRYESVKTALRSSPLKLEIP